mgnify:CR=1 FL=1
MIVATIVVLAGWVTVGLTAAGYVLWDERRASETWADVWSTPIYVMAVALGACVICGPWAWKIIRDCKREEANRVSRG